MHRSTRRMICHVCQRPALTMSDEKVPYCGRHALRFVDVVQLSRHLDTVEPVTADSSPAASG